jgi:hypothetical protein
MFNLKINDFLKFLILKFLILKNKMDYFIATQASLSAFNRIVQVKCFIDFNEAFKFVTNHHFSEFGV